MRQGATWQWLAIAMILLSAAFSIHAGDDPGNPPMQQVLVLASYHMTHEWTKNMVDTIIAETPRGDQRLVFDVVEFDALRTSDREAQVRKFQRCLERMKAKQYVLVVALDDMAINFVLEHYQELPPELPVVFAGYESCPADLKEKYPNVTGVVQQFGTEATIRLALSLYPQTEVVAILTDSSAESRAFAARLHATLPEFPGVKMIYIDNGEFKGKALFDRIAALPENSLLLLCPWRGVQENAYLNLSAFGLDLAQVCKRPYLVSADPLLGFGALGGYVTVATEHGRAAAELIRRTLSRKSARDIPVEQGKVRPVFDYRMLQQQHLDLSKLPPDVLLVNQPPGVWMEYRYEIMGVGVVLLLLVVGMGIYLVAVRRVNRQSLELYQALPGRIGVLARNESILYFKAETGSGQGTAKPACLKDVAGADYPKLTEAVKTVFETGKKTTLDYEYHAVRRSVTFALLPRHLFRQDAVVWFSHDNAELQKTRLQAEGFAEQLRSERELYSLALDTMPVMFFAKDIRNEYRYVMNNRAYENFFKAERGALLGKTDGDFLHEAAEISAVADVDRGIVAGTAGMAQFYEDMTDGGGRIRRLQVVKQVYRGADGRELLLGAAWDVTDLREALDRSKALAAELQKERELAIETAEHLKLTFRAIGDGVLTTDAEGNITMLNPVAERMMGCTQAEAMGRPHTEFFRIVSYLDDWPSPSPLTRALRTGGVVELANHTDLLAQDGRRYHIADSAAPIFSHAGKLIGAILVFRDVTEDYAQRDRLRKALTSLEYSSELTFSAAFCFDPATGEITGSKMLPELLPVENDRMSMPLGEWIYPDDWEKVEADWTALVGGKAEDALFDYRSSRRGEMRYYRLRAAADRSDPRTVKFVGVIQDITDITRSIGRLRETQELWELVINSIPIIFFAKDPNDDFRYVLCNRALAEFVGKPRGEIIGRTDAELFHSEEDAQRFLDRDREIMAEPAGKEFEESALDADGVRHHFKTLKKAFTETTGRTLLLGVANDISELKDMIRSEQIVNRALSQIVVDCDFDKNLRRVFDVFAEQADCDGVAFAVYDGEGAEYALQDVWTRSGLPAEMEVQPRTIDRLLAAYGETMRGNELVMLSDAAKAEIFEGAQESVPRSVIGAPIFIDEKLWAVIFVSFFRIRRHFSAVDEKLMRSMASIIALARIRERQEWAVKQADHEKQMILDHIDIPIWLHDSKGELVRANTAVGELAGIVPGRLTTEKNWEIFNANLPDGVLRPVYEALATGRPVRREVVYLKRNYIVSAKPVFDESGALSYIVKSAVDVTDLNELILNHQVVNYCLEAFFRDPDAGKAIQAVLEAICRHMGATRCYILAFDSEKHTATGLAEYVEPGRQPVVMNCNAEPFAPEALWYRKILRRETIFCPELNRPRVLAGLGGWKKMILDHQMKSLYAAGIYLQGKLWGGLGIVYEDGACERLSEHRVNFLKSAAHLVELMLERKQAQERLLLALEQAQAADRAKSFFVASISHEIRTPLNAVIGFAELLRDNALQPDIRREYLDSIAFAGNSLLQLINDVLDLSKLEAGQMQIITEPLEFTPLAEDVLKVFRYRAEQNEVALLSAVPPLPVMELDKLRIRQILFNLMGNAVKFTTAGSVTLRAEFQPDDDCVGTFKFMVDDTGSGIAEADREKMLEPFVQLSGLRGTNAANNGTGLGLPIAKRLAERMGGELWLESELGRGSTFGVTLYKVRYQKDTVSLPPVPEEKPSGGSVAGDFSRIAVLLVDDVVMNLKVMTAMCAKIGVGRVAAAESGKAALAELEKGHFDLVLTDMWMPEMTGVELARAIHADGRREGLTITAVTADVEVGNHFLMEEFSGVLLKPVTIDKIRRVLMKLPGVSAVAGDGVILEE